MLESSDNLDQRILILAPIGRDAAMTQRFLGDANLPSEVCGSIEEMCRKILEGSGLAFLTGEALTSEAIRFLTETLSQQPTWSDLPLIVLISGGSETPANADALAALGIAGNVTLIERPVRAATLLSAIRSALRARRRQYDVRNHLAGEERAAAERERLLLSEQSARAEAETASRLKDEFLATVSHELRTPLTAVLGWIHILRGGQLDAAAATHALGIIERNAQSQNQLIEDLLDVSRIITGKLRLDVRPVDPAAIIESAIEAILPAAEAKEIRLQKVLDTGVSSISGDPARLQQVIWNLLSNAIKFTPKGGRVHVSLERINSHIEISVTDSGEGIKKDFLPFVFDRFRQADGTSVRRYGGLGLGLAVVRHLIELHGGTVQAASSGEGQGAVFTIKLPLLPVYRREMKTERLHPAQSDTPPPIEYPDNLAGLKVLVVDDEADTLEMIKVLLGQCGAKVTTANSSAEALKALERMRPDVIISDIGMPIEDGFQFMQKVRQLPPEKGGKIPAVALTAYARAEDRLRVLRSGYQMHISKPVELAELVAVVANVGGQILRDEG
jgi:signal transduction histidine kinase/ActR/RegA family two-component response regulator